MVGLDAPSPDEAYEFPASYAQERLWFLDRFAPGSPVYNVPLAMRVRGGLRREALERALRGLVERHEILRTRFESAGGRPVQVVSRGVSGELLEVVDLRGRADAEAEVSRQAAREAGQAFDLRLGPLLRVKQVLLPGGDDVVLLTLHHIVCDGWSMQVLLKELDALYAAACTGQPAGLPELAIQYADYAVWQRQFLSGEVLEQHLGHWRSLLSGAPGLLELSTDRPRPAVQSFRGALRSLQFEERAV